MPKKRKNKLPTFISTHPLKLEAYLKLCGYKTFFYIKSKEEVFKERKKTVIILLSLLELQDFLKEASANRVKRVRLVVFSNRREINFFPKLKPVLDIRWRKEIKIFIPYHFKLGNSETYETNWEVGNLGEPNLELEKSIQLSKKLLTLTST